MKKMIALVIAGVAMIGLSGCNITNFDGNPSNDTIGQVYNDELSLGYKISGTDTTIGEKADFCFYGNSYVYGRGDEYFEGTFSISGGDIVFKDQTDGGAYRLETNGEIIRGYTYYFGTTLSNNINVTTIARSHSVSDCKVEYGKGMRMASSLHLASKPK